MFGQVVMDDELSPTDDYEPTDDDITAALDVLGADASDVTEAAGNVQTLIRTFNSKWAKGPHPHAACVAALTGKVSDPAALCAWIKDRATGTTKWRGKGKKESVEADETGMLLEALDGDGWRWRVQLIEAGLSANGNLYPLGVLHEAAPAYAGVPAFFGKGPDHNSNERGVDSIAGYIVDPLPNPRGIGATLEVNRGKPEVREAIRHAYSIKERVGRAPFGFSHVVPRGGFQGKPRKPYGYEVTRISRVSSVDLVIDPAAGGALLSPLAESQQFVSDALQEAFVDIAKLLAKLREGKKLDMDELAHLHESLTPEQLAEALASAAKQPEPKQEPQTPPQPAGLTEAAEARIRELEEASKRDRAAALLTVKLAESKLPDEMKDGIRADFDGRLFEAADLDARIERDRGIAAKLANVRPHGLGSRVEVTEDQREKHQKAMDGLVWGRPMDGIKPFLTLKEAYQEITGDRSYSFDNSVLPRKILQEAISFAGDDPLLKESIITSTFGDVLGDSIRRRMMQEFGRPDRQNWRAVSSTFPVTDFRTFEINAWGGYGFLPEVNEGAPYQPLTSPGDQKATDSLDKYGGLEDITMETIANDDMGVVRRIPVKLGYAAVDTLYNAFWNTTIKDNAVYSADTTALYHANHNNTGTAALDEAGLSAIRVAMRDQTEYGNATGLPLGEANTPRIIAVPNELEIAAFKLVNSAVAITSGSDATVPNFFNNRLNVIVVDSWTDANNWYAFADPSIMPSVEVGFFQGREEPELFVQDAQTVGSVFTADKITYKIRHIWVIVIVEPRATYRQVVT